MQFVIKSTGVANRFSVMVPPPKSRLAGLAISTWGTFSPWRALNNQKYNFNQNKCTQNISVFPWKARQKKYKNKKTYQSSLWFNERTVLSVHFIIKTTSIAQVVSVSISSPKWCRCCSTINAFSTFCLLEKIISLCNW